MQRAERADDSEDREPQNNLDPCIARESAKRRHRATGSATKPQKIRAPAIVAEAAKWAVSVTTIGPLISAPNQIIALSQRER